MRAALWEGFNSGLALFLACTLVVTLTPVPAMAQSPGGIIRNGTNTDPVVVPGFLFEPEFPLNSLKTVPTWNEIEQLLDDPYRVAVCSSLPASVDPLVRNTPGTTQIPGSPPPVVYSSYCSTSALVRRPGFGVTLPPLLVHPLNYNPTDGEEMRLLNPSFTARNWSVPDELVQFGNSNTYYWRYRRIPVTPGNGRVEAGGDAEIDYNAPINADYPVPNLVVPMLPNLSPQLLIGLNSVIGHCITQVEAVPPEGSIICGGDTGEPAGYLRPGLLCPGTNAADILACSIAGGRNGQYSTPGVPGASPLNIPPNARLFAPGRALPEAVNGVIQPRNAAGMFGLRKPSLRTAVNGGTSSNPNFLRNRTDSGAVADDPSTLVPSNENDYVLNRDEAAALGKSLFWDQQVGSDAVQACGSCHAHAGADNRTKNQINPNHLGPQGFSAAIDVNGHHVNEDLVVADFPFHKTANPDVANDPKCGSPLVATVAGGVLEHTPSASTGATGTAATGVSMTVCQAAGLPDSDDVASSMGVHFGRFKDIPIGAFGPPDHGVSSVLPDERWGVGEVPDSTDPIADFAGSNATLNEFRRVEPRNTPTVFAADLNFDNFWDGRARHDDNGGSVFGPADPQSHVFVSTSASGDITPTRQVIRFSSLASLAKGPGLSEFEMSFQGRNWAKIGKKLLQPGVTPLANQLVAANDSILGRYSNQGGSACAGLPASDRSPAGMTPTTLGLGVPGLCISYPALIDRAFYPALRQNTNSHLEGCYTDAVHHPTGPLCAAGVDDPFDTYVLNIANGTPADPANTNQFTQKEGNFGLFWGQALHIWASLLMPDNTPLDQFLDKNPDMFESIGEANEPGLVGPVVACSGTNAATQRHCFRPVGNFKRDAASTGALNCNALPQGGEGGGTTSLSDTLCRGPVGQRRVATDPDPLLGMDIFQGSNYSLKNPNFRAARCGECHAGGTLTDNTMPFTLKAQIGDFIGEFIDAGNEALVEPLGRTRVISGFLLESEFAENGQDAVERRMNNQSIVPCPTDGLAYPGGLDGGSGQGFGICSGAAQGYFDNGVYNLGVRPINEDVGRGGTDAFGWPLSLAALMLKNAGGNNGAVCTSAADCVTEPGQPLATFDPDEGNGGGLFEETAQDQQLNPGEDDDLENPLLPPYLAPWANRINVGDSMPELDEIFSGLNTLTDTAMLEGFVDTLGPFNPAGVMNESMNMGDSVLMGSWPVVNRVARNGSFKAPQLREVELTGPYFHNGGKLTLRQVVDFYSRGGDFPITNASDRDFNLVNMNVEFQSNLSEQEKISLVDFLLELTDDRVAFERAPFDHPEAIIPLDGRAPENTGGRAAMLASCTTNDPAVALSPGSQVCAGGAFLDIPASGANGIATRLPGFLGVERGNRNNPNCNPGNGPISHYCH
jgi:cytochrome c peroxidase